MFLFVVGSGDVQSESKICVMSIRAVAVSSSEMCTETERM